MAGMEDARIKSGNGTVDRSTNYSDSYNTQTQGMSVSQYAARRRALAPSGELSQTIEKLKAEQAPLRKQIEDQVKVIATEEARYQ